MLRGKFGKEHSKDMLGLEVRETIEEQVAKIDPFNISRSTMYSFQDTPATSPFQGLNIEMLEKFIASKKREYNLEYHEV